MFFFSAHSRNDTFLLICRIGIDSSRGSGTGKGCDIESPKSGVDGHGTGTRGTNSYAAGSRGMDFHGTGSPNYRYHSPTSAYQYSPTYHDPHSIHGFTYSDPFMSESRGLHF